jgi:hypothetical protein
MTAVCSHPVLRCSPHVRAFLDSRRYSPKDPMEGQFVGIGLFIRNSTEWQMDAQLYVWSRSSDVATRVDMATRVDVVTLGDTSVGLLPRFGDTLQRKSALLYTCHMPTQRKSPHAPTLIHLTPRGYN